MGKLMVLLALALLPLCFAQGGCEASCCEGEGGTWDYSDGTCTEPADEYAYISCSMDCEEDGYGGYGNPGSSVSCCGPAALLGAIGAAALLKR